MLDLDHVRILNLIIYSSPGCRAGSTNKGRLAHRISLYTWHCHCYRGSRCILSKTPRSSHTTQNTR